MQSARSANCGESMCHEETLCPACSNISPSTAVPLTLCVASGAGSLAVGASRSPARSRRRQGGTAGAAMRTGAQTCRLADTCGRHGRAPADTFDTADTAWHTARLGRVFMQSTSLPPRGLETRPRATSRPRSGPLEGAVAEEHVLEGHHRLLDQPLQRPRSCAKAGAGGSTWGAAAKVAHAAAPCPISRRYWRFVFPLFRRMICCLSSCTSW